MYRLGLLLCLLIGLLAPPASWAAEKRALLVGVTDYPHLPEKSWLKGPTNDVELVQEILTKKRFGFSPKHVRVLAGWPEEKAERPTRANIVAALDKLVKDSGRGDTVFILMSGHGSQQPANDDPSDIETDGLDEVFLPADTEKWDPVKKHIKGAIADDEYKNWIDALRDKGAFVWIIFDSCHSGTMTRGAFDSGRTNRHIPPQDLIPEEVLEATSKTRSVGMFVERIRDLVTADTDTDTDADPQRGKLVAMYAAQSLEPTFELPMPPPDGPRRGLFTTMIMKIIDAAEQPLSYRDLAASVDAVYRSNGILQPTPLIEGDGIDTPVLGKDETMERPDAILTGISHPVYGFEMNVGHLLGMRPGTVLEVFSPALAKEKKQSLGTVKVTRAEATKAFVKPHAWGESKAADPSLLGVACRLEVQFFDLGLGTLKLAVETSSSDKGWQVVDPKTLEGADAKTISAIIASAGGRYQLTAGDETADWYVQLDGKGGGALVSATGFSKTLTGGNPNHRFVFASAGQIAKSLAGIARARGLLEIGGSTSRRTALPMSVEVVRFAEPGSDKAEVVKFAAGGRSLKAGDEIAFKIKNRSAASIDVTLLLIDDAFAIASVFPEPGTIDDNRIPGGATFTTPRLIVTAERPVMEQLVTLAVRSTKQRHDFTCLEQSALGTARGGDAMDSPLGQLLKSNLYGDGSQHRGLRRSSFGDYSASIITWTARP